MKSTSLFITLLCLIVNSAWSEQDKDVNILIKEKGTSREIIEINGKHITLNDELDGLDKMLNDELDGLDDMEIELHKLVKVLKSMGNEGESDQAFIGILLEEDDADATGVNVIGITPDSPAQSAGIKAGDIITAINGSNLARDPKQTPAHKLFKILKKLKAAEKLELELLRNGQQISLSLIAAKRGDHLRHGLNYLAEDLEQNLLKRHSGQLGGNLAGVELYPLNEDLGGYFGSSHGMLILHVPKDKNLPLQSGDVILKIGERTPVSASQTWRILHSYDHEQSIKITLIRHGEQITLSLDNH